METEKVKQIERQLESRGYKRYTQNLIGNEDYAYMKTTRNADGELKYIISHGFYDWEDYEGALENYGYTPTIVLGNTDERIDVTLTEPEFSVDECEEIADKLAEFFKPYFDKYGEKTIFKAKRKMNNYCKKCRLRDGCIRKCKEAEVYEQGYNDAYKKFEKAWRTAKELITEYK